MIFLPGMDDDSLKEPGGSKVLTSEQQQKLQDLQRRRQHIQKAEEERNKKKKSKKKGQKKGSEGPESGNGEQASTSTRDVPAAAPTKDSSQRRRLDIESHSFTPSKERTIIPANEENPQEKVQAVREIEDITAQVGSNHKHAAQPAPVVKQKGDGEGGSATSARRKRKKLYWGLDSKERWERKSNM